MEKSLTRDIGEIGKKLHTARSRNDQVATATRLWLRKRIDVQLRLLAQTRKALLNKAQLHTDTLMPGFTHLQVAQPTTLGHHLHAYACMLERDAQRLRETRARTNILPLGAAALAGTSHAIEPGQVADELGFDGLCKNSMDAVSDRDYILDYLSCASVAMIHLSRIGEEIVIWCSQPFGFAHVPDSFSTGSSIMPQKRNPDAAELIRGKSGRVLGHLMATLAMLKGQPLAYNKDNQEDKEALFDVSDTLEACLEIAAPMIKGLRFDRKAMKAALEKGYATATELADLLVKKGVPFRDAHSMVSRAVRKAEQANMPLSELPSSELEKITNVRLPGLKQHLNEMSAVNSRTSPGGPSPRMMKSEIRSALKRVEKEL